MWHRKYQRRACWVHHHRMRPSGCLAPLPWWLASGWAVLHDATLPGWQVGRPSFHDGLDQWEQYAFDLTERPKVEQAHSRMVRGPSDRVRSRARDGALPAARSARPLAAVIAQPRRMRGPGGPVTGDGESWLLSPAPEPDGRPWTTAKALSIAPSS